MCGDVPGREVFPAAGADVCENGVAENVSGDCAGCPVGSVNGGESGSWENVVGHVGGRDVEIEWFVKCDECGEKVAGVVVVVRMD